MSNLTLSSGAHLDAQGAVVLRVANRFGRTNGGVIGPAPGVTPTARGVRLEVSGTNGTTGAITATPKAAAFGTGNTVRALVLLPNGGPCSPTPASPGRARSSDATPTS
jgi:hypothetical protein